MNQYKLNIQALISKIEAKLPDSDDRHPATVGRRHGLQTAIDILKEEL